MLSCRMKKSAQGKLELLNVLEIARAYIKQSDQVLESLGTMPENRPTYAHLEMVHSALVQAKGIAND